MWTHNYEPVGGSLGMSAVVAAIPLLVLFVMLASGGSRRDVGAGGARVGAARRADRVPHARAAGGDLTIYGAAFGLFPIAWIVFTSILLYRLAVYTGKFEIIKTR